MEEYTIRDPQTGREVTVRGDSPPTAEDIEAIFATMPAPIENIPAPTETRKQPGFGDYAMEAVAGFNRPAAQLFDIATAPGQFLLNLAGFDVPTLRSTVPERGEFAGQGRMTDIVSASGEMGSMAFTGGGITSRIAAGLRDVARFGDDVLSRVIQSMGGRGPVKDLVEGAASGAGGEIAAQQASDRLGPQYEEYGRLGGQLLSPAVWSATSSQIRRVSENILEQAAPSVETLRGASRANFNMLDEAGITANGPSSSALSRFIDDFIEQNNVDRATGLATLAGRLNSIKRAAEEGRVTYGFLADAISDMRKIGQGSDTQATLLKEVASDLDNILVNMTPSSQEALGGRSVQEVLTTARSLWRRASVSQTIDDLVQDATIDSERNRSDLVRNLRSRFGKLVMSDNKRGRYLTKEEREIIRDFVRGGRIEKMLEIAENIGFNSDDLVRSVIFQGLVGGGTFALSGSQAAAGTAIVGSTMLGAAMRAGANKIFKNNANFARSLIKAGTNGQEIAKSYLRNVPASKRNPRDLTLLFLNNKADLSEIKDTTMARNPLISDAVALAIAAQPLFRTEEPASQTTQ